MFKNYLKVAFRSLNKNRIYALINILGLALGLTVTILVFMFVKDEMSYDKHWSDADRIYRTGIKANMMGQKMDAPVSPNPMAAALRSEFANVETATRVQSGRQNPDALRAKKCTSSTWPRRIVPFLKFLIMNLFMELETALKEENAVVLTEETARKLFGDKNAMGEIVNYDNRRDCIVRGL